MHSRREFARREKEGQRSSLIRHSIPPQKNSPDFSTCDHAVSRLKSPKFPAFILCRARTPGMVIETFP